MTIQQIQQALDAVLLSKNRFQNGEIDHVYASDLMSDVLAFGKPNSLLLTGLVTQQAVISAHMAEFKAVVFIRGKQPKDNSCKIADQNGIVLMSTPLDMYESCVRLYEVQSAGKINQGVITEKDKTIEEFHLTENFTIEGNDFANAGAVSTEIKSILKKIGLDPQLIRRIAISTYEAEMNVVMHAQRGEVTLNMTPESITIIVADIGKGIENIDLALQEGYTTATDEMRAMGFGSGMGLPNIKRNSDDLQIESEVGKGTRVTMTFFISQ
jgi:anti-sigma regulatory factor (Ser/Thr protein kinase)